MTNNLFSAFNRTELYQLCRRVGFNIPPTTSVEKMIVYLQGEEEAPMEPNIFNSWRDAIMLFLLEHWKAVESQLTCPAKSGDPRSCYQCIDQQVISCIVQQSPYDQKLIELRRK